MTDLKKFISLNSVLMLRMMNKEKSGMALELSSRMEILIRI